MRTTRFFVLAFMLIAFIGSSLAKEKKSGSAPQFEVKKKITLGGDGGWDYLTYDPNGKRLFISRATHVIVVDPESGKQIGDIANTNGVHGIALAQEFGKGFTSNGRDSNVTVFDLKSLKEEARVATGDGPDAIVYDPASKRVFTMNGRAHSTTAIDAQSNNVAGQVPLDGKPEFAVADGKGTVFVNIEDKSEVQAIDARQLKVTHTWPMGKCQEPSGMAIDRKHRRLFSGCDNSEMAILDADSGKVVAEVPIGEGVDANGFDPELGIALSSNGGDGTLTIVHEDSPDKFSVAQNVQTERGARTMALDEKTHSVYTVTAKFGPREQGERRPKIVPGTFELIVVGEK